MAEKQRQRRLHIEPKRGTIYDRNGAPLAVSIEVPSVSVDAVELLRGVEGEAAQEATLRDAAARIGKALSLDAADVYGKLASRRRFVWLKRRISGDEAEAVRDLGDPKRQPHPVHGLTIEGEGHRYYPGRELAGPLLGFVAPDGQGKDGLELALDEDLRGKVEEVHGLRDRSGRLIFEGGSARGRPSRATTSSSRSTRASSTSPSARSTRRCTPTRPRAARSSWSIRSPGRSSRSRASPGYNPNDYTESEADARRDRTVTDRFEPGSVMKPFLMAAALAAGTLKPDRLDQLRARRLPDRRRDDPRHAPERHASRRRRSSRRARTSARSRSASSSASRRSTRRYRRFGFGEPTGIPLPGEASGVLRPKGRAWYDAETASASFGQGISVTTLQLAMAMSAIANGGRLLEPILVKKVTDGRGETVRESSVARAARSDPAGVARMVAEMLTAVTEDGGHRRRGGDPRFSRRRQDVDRAEGRPRDGQVLDGQVHGRVRRLRPRRAPAPRRRRRARRADDRALRRRPRGPGVPSRGGGELALPRRHAVAARRPKIASVKREGDPADATLAAMNAVAAAPAPARRAASVRRRRDAIRVPDATGLPAHDVVVALSKAGFVPQIEGWGRARAADAAARRPPLREGAPCGWCSSRRHERRREARSARSWPGPRPRAGARRARRASCRCSRRGGRRRRARPGVRHDSRAVEPGDLFVARRGEKVDGARFVRDAMERGATAVLAARERVDAQAVARARRRGRRSRGGARLRGLRGLRAPVVLPRGRRHHGHQRKDDDGAPRARRDRRRPGATALRRPRHRGAPLRRRGRSPAEHTTPEADDIARTMAEMRARGATHVAMEVSSHALALGRLRGVHLRVAALTNLTQDHLDFHGSMQAYAETKARLFTELGPGAAVVNVDDAFGRDLAARVKAPLVRVSARTRRAPRRRDRAARRRASSAHGYARDRAHAARRRDASPRASSARTTSRTCCSRWASRTPSSSISREPPTRSRASRARPGGSSAATATGDDVIVLVDYAHTPDALARALDAVRAVDRGRASGASSAAAATATRPSAGRWARPSARRADVAS